MSDLLHLLSPRTANIEQSASFWRRALAFLFDLLLIDALITAPFTPLFTGLIARTGNDPFNVVFTRTEIIAVALLFLIVYVYFVLFEYLLGQTVGMMLLDIRMDGVRPLWAAAVRNVFLFPVFPLVILWVAEPIAIAVWRRSLLEQLTGTRTVHRQTILL
jgi:hypothetical protein